MELRTIPCVVGAVCGTTEVVPWEVATEPVLGLDVVGFDVLAVFVVEDTPVTVCPVGMSDVANGVPSEETVDVSL